MRKFVTLPARNSQAIKSQIPQCFLLSPDARTHITLGRYTDNTLLAAALDSAVNSNSLCLGSQVHGHHVKLGFSSDVFSCNNVIRMYSKLGYLDWGLNLFDEMPDRNVVSWTLIISGAAQNGDFELGMKAFSGMIGGGVRPNEFSFGSVMKLCSTLASNAALGIHCFAVKIGIEENPFVSSSILNFYAMIGDIGSAEQLFFPSMDCLVAGCWNTMIGAYAHCGYGVEAVRVLSLMRRYGLSADNYTYVSGLKGCAVTSDLRAGKVIHGLMIIQGEFLHSTDSMNALVDMYFKLGKNSSALKVFDKIPNKDVISWNSVFSSICQDENDACELRNFFIAFMLSGLRPSCISFTVLLKQCARLCNLNLGLQFYGLSIQLGYSNEDFVVSTLVDMFSRCDATEMALAVFDSVASSHILIWNALIRGYSSNGCNPQALEIFRKSRLLQIVADECTFSCILEASCGLENSQMSKQIHGSLIKSGFMSHGLVYSSLLKAYARAELLGSFKEFLNDLNALDLPSWSTMMSVLVYHGCYPEVIQVLKCLLEGGKRPDEFILGSILNSCADTAASHHTGCVHSLVLKSGFQLHPVIASALVDAYAKCGEIKNAESIFTKSFFYGDNVLFNTMIMGYAHHGLVDKALEICQLMKQVNLQPSLPTFVSLISACSHLGHVNRGLAVFRSISSDYKCLQTSQDLFGCVVDMLARYGYLEDAKSMIDTMPFPPWPAIWRSLLSGCRIHCNIHLGKWAAAKLTQMNPNDDAAYVLLLEIYSEGSHWDNAAKVKDEMATKGVSKTPAYSRIGM